ncbi:nitroreductase family protein [Sediminitomix flava]|uniref:Nitroreductase n=1 Tax=Sediminitomix flava TaxID=379075 RepID=A0A315ZB45_SEDFL|nr:nitroreductase family protein [Sediminitomix flava]PWJ42379.1 nitroreductase [Sediminitomix flava]
MEKFKLYEAQKYTEQESIEKSKYYFEYSNQRRSIREFSDKPVPKEVIENIIKSASTAPSGANKQPWFFCAVSSSMIKKEIRKAAEEEEYENYHGRMSDDWLEDLKKFGTNEIKPFLEVAPWLIIVFKQVYELNEEGDKSNNYYVNESVGLASGMLLSAIHNAGLVSLTHTPSPMNFLQKILDRPKNEKPFLLIPVGYPANGVEVPDIERKSLESISKFFE